LLSAPSQLPDAGLGIESFDVESVKDNSSDIESVTHNSSDIESVKQGSSSDIESLKYKSSDIESVKDNLYAIKSSTRVDLIHSKSTNNNFTDYEASFNCEYFPLI